MVGQPGGAVDGPAHGQASASIGTGWLCSAYGNRSLNPASCLKSAGSSQSVGEFPRKRGADVLLRHHHVVAVGSSWRSTAACRGSDVETRRAMWRRGRRSPIPWGTRPARRGLPPAVGRAGGPGGASRARRRTNRLPWCSRVRHQLVLAVERGRVPKAAASGSGRSADPGWVRNRNRPAPLHERVVAGEAHRIVADQCAA